MNILILASQHGNEYSGEKLYRHIQRKRPELLGSVSFMVGNPKARRRKVRLTESDMNRSYSGRTDTYEQRRAQKILTHINETGYDLVLDMHTTTIKQLSCIIIAALGRSNEAFIRASSIDTIVTVAQPISSNALNGVLPQVVSIEVNQDITPETLDALCDDIARFISGQTYGKTRSVYEVTELLSKTELDKEQLATLHNFEYSDFGFYPVLVGENSYEKHTDYLGFKAYKRHEFKV